ncbi:MAG: tetratricopeptide repeat protein, partial [Planctomycetota bacterium]
RRLVEEQGNAHYLAAASLYAEGECLRDLGRNKAALKRFREAAACEQAGRSDGKSADKDHGKFGLPALYQAGFLLLRDGQHQEAAASFALAARRYPKHKARGECLYLAGEAALRGGDTRSAERAYRQAVAAGGEHGNKALLGLARCAREAGDKEQAVTRFRDAGQRLENSADGRQARVEAGRLLFELKRYREAVAELSAVLALAGLSADLRRNALEVAGLAYLQLGQPQPAIQHLGKALTLTEATDKAGRARIAYHVGEAHADKKDWDAAVAYYDRTIAGTAKKALLGDALYGKCLALHRLGRFDESNRAAAELVKRAPEHRLVTACWFAWAENHFATKDYETAREAYVAIPEDHELAQKARFKAAWCSYLLKDYKGAAQAFRKLAGDGSNKTDPIREEALSMAALAFFQGDDLDNALATADRYRARYPKGSHLARTERVAARVLKQQGKLAAAADRLAAAAGAERSGDRAGRDLLEYADVLYKRGDYAGAQRAYRKVSDQQDATGARAHEGLAWCAFELGDDKACREWIDRGLKHPHAASSRANLLELRSALSHRNQDWAAAEQAAEQFLKEFRNHPRALHLRYALGVAQSRNGKPRQARRTLRRLAGHDGFDRFERADRVHYELAWVHRKLRDEPAALESFRGVARLSRDDDLRGEANLHLGEALLADGNVDEALALLSKVKGKYRARARYRIGFSWFERDQPKQALPAFADIVGLGPEAGLYLDAVFLAGECHYRLGQFKAAAQQFRKLLKAAPDHERAQPARLHLGASEIQNHHAKDAAAVLEEYLRRAGETKTGEAKTGERARANLWLGQARQRSRDWARAEAAYQNTTRLTDSELAAEAQYRIGECRRSRGDLNGAADAFVKLPILYGHDTWVQRGLLAAGDCYQRLKQPKKAQRFYQELVTRYPDAELTKDARRKLEDIKRRL